MGSTQTDVLALGNICLDVVIPVDTLPPEDPVVRRRMLDELTASPPGQVGLEQVMVRRRA
jgi:hypothetical protein